MRPRRLGVFAGVTAWSSITIGPGVAQRTPLRERRSGAVRQMT